MKLGRKKIFHNSSMVGGKGHKGCSLLSRHHVVCVGPFILHTDWRWKVCRSSRSHVCCCLLWNRWKGRPEGKQRGCVTVIAEGWRLGPQLPSPPHIFQKRFNLLPLLHSFTVISLFTSLLPHLIKKQVLLILPP